MGPLAYAVLTDDSVLHGLGVAHALRDALIDSGRVPPFLLSKLKQGPGKHIKTYAYQYDQKLAREVTTRSASQIDSQPRSASYPRLARMILARRAHLV